MTTDPGAIDPRSARTAFRVLSRLRSTTVLQVQPLSGRKHQIRVHLAAEGYPLLGDAFYANNATYSSRHALHAVSIVFRHPITRAMLRIDAPIPADFWETLALCQF